MENEVWKDIPKYEGLYQASNLGRIRSCARTIIRENRIKQQFKGKILSPEDNGNGYLRLILYKNKKKNSEYVHRLIASAFIENYYNCEQINHIDGNKQNNNINNLEWCTKSYNIKEAYRLGLKTAPKTMLGRKSYKNHLSKPVNQYDLQGNFIKRWHCINDVQRELNIFTGNITRVCKGEYKQTGGYIWKYADEKLQKIN